MFEYKYLSESHLKGFRSYKIIPKWIAPNLLTFAGFICMLVDVMLLMVLDYDCTASANGSPAQIPREVFLLWY
ncbi:unnamed protein product [Leptidea sinapis]|uniref:Uncharacterized protein n=1 Tax=Leptidea sinapis TaxID=189913 RepID=A0A5E4PKH6_9NEOP|nr:unnamed protein product [Leptidea sinapis]